MFKNNNAFEDLICTISTLDGEGEIKSFLIDLCTTSEINAISERWIVAKLLSSGISYRAISEKTGVSTATITRVARALKYGPGYKNVIEKMEINSTDNIETNNNQSLK